MQRTLLVVVFSFGLAGCAVIKTTDVTDASFKRHQSLSVLGWPLYTRITDKEPGATANVANRYDTFDPESHVRAAEMLGRSIEPDFPGSEDR